MSSAMKMRQKLRSAIREALRSGVTEDELVSLTHSVASEPGLLQSLVERYLIEARVRGLDRKAENGKSTAQ